MINPNHPGFKGNKEALETEIHSLIESLRSLEPSDEKIINDSPTLNWIADAIERSVTVTDDGIESNISTFSKSEKKLLILSLLDLGVLTLTLPPENPWVIVFEITTDILTLVITSAMD